MAAIKAIYTAVMNDNATVLIISPNQRQSNILFRRMKYLLNKNAAMPEEVRIPITDMVTRETQTVIELANGSALYSLPATETGDNIRGYTSTMVIVDEAAYIKDEVYKVIRPMLITTNGTLILSGTPNGIGNYFFKAYSNSNWGFSVHHMYPSTISPLVSKDVLEREREALPDTEFRQEYLAEFVDVSGVVFPATEYDACVKRELKEREGPLNREDYQYVLGYDPARFGDDDGVGVILEKRTVYSDLVKDKGVPTWRIVKMIEVKQMPLTEQIKLIKKLHNEWCFKRITVDTTGMGGGITDALEEARLPVEAFQFSYKSKAELFFNLKKIIEERDVVLPENQKLRKQMIELRREQSEKSGFIKIFHPRRGADDYPTALALAAWAGTKHKAVDVLFGTSKGVFGG